MRPGGEWPYLPRRLWQGALSYHRTFLESGNLEVRADIGVQGRDGMALPMRGGGLSADALATVPFYQSWYARLQLRIVTVRVFVLWENFTFRDANQDYPGRLLPRSRTLYGVRWVMWN